MKVQVYDVQGKEKGSIELADSVFNVKPNKSVIYYTLRAELANARQGTSDTKGRSDVNGSGAKPWRQKGTGRARAGSKRSPLWSGGGVVFGPHPRDYRVRMNRKEKQLSIRSVLSLKVRDNDLKVMEDFSVGSGRTKDFSAIARSLVEDPKRRRVLIVDRDAKAENKRAGRNIPWVKYHSASMLSTKDLYYATQLILTESAVAALNEKYSS